ncbi:S-adenosylmethionine:tRNA ribosyltransferase-isomerase [Streptomyces sp. NPDC000410]|uniref:S-adenosylmethionine:tRNA ribosyltransferase-isomerase n=1 Tax=Streptomyces sp. NPDC000410 TaxID=3154254 RepID=UPI0033166F36
MAGPGVLGALRVPDGLSARVPAEERGGGRDDVRLMVSRGAEVSHHAFRELPGLLRAGDVLVVNTSATLPAAVNGRLAGERLVVHFSTRGDDGRWAVELRTPDGAGSTRPRAGGPAGARIRLPGGGALVLEEPVVPGGARLWWAAASVDVPELMRRRGRPIRYRYTERDQPLAAYQTVFALAAPDGAGSAEMPSAARPFTAELVAELVRRGVQFAPVTLHTGVASAEVHEPPYPERFEVSAATAWLVNAARAGGGRVLAVGTTAVRALESAAGPDRVVRAAGGWTDLVVTPARGVGPVSRVGPDQRAGSGACSCKAEEGDMAEPCRPTTTQQMRVPGHASPARSGRQALRVVDGLLTGLHEPEASHLLMLEALAGREALGRGYAEAVRRLYLWHEFGDVHLILPDEASHTLRC